MPTVVKNKSKSLQGITDLTLVANIRRGLIPALDSRSYESRLRVLLATLSGARAYSKEAEPTPLIDDAIGRIQSIQSFRLAIVGELRKQLVLSVAFDGGWEQYMRRIWRDLGPLLDVIFCNCEGYLTSFDHSFAQYTGWVRSAQVDTEFFYGASGLTVADMQYLRESERQRLGSPAPAPVPAPGKANPADVLQQALPGLTALYRLNDLYPPADLYPTTDATARRSDDSQILLRAAEHLLRQRMTELGQLTHAGRSPTETAALAWIAAYRQQKQVVPPARAVDLSRVQGGILDQYEDITDGCLLLVHLRDAAAARALIDHVGPQISTAAQQKANAAQLLVNLAFSYEGLQVTGVPDSLLRQMPFEFAEGMAARASVLGDREANHPTHWSLPKRNGPSDAPGNLDRVEMSSVHGVVQLSINGLSNRPKAQADLDAAIRSFDHALAPHGVQILHVQPMQRFITQKGESSKGHFKFLDGLSQPVLASPPFTTYSDQVPAGDVLLGHPNSLGDPPMTGRLWDDSTFLVIRKLRQNVDALEGLTKDLAKLSGLTVDEVGAKLMGREANGQNLITQKKSNDFDYKSDATGAKCPFQSHVRRSNPRETRDPDLLHVPRIVRRGMSYGPPHVANDGVDRGLIFLGFNSSIAEQYEVLQAWLNGGDGNGPKSYSALRDPITGSRAADDPMSFVAGPGQTWTLPAHEPLVRLQWGLYTFVPSMKALGELRMLADEAVSLRDGERDDDKKRREEAQRRARAALALRGAAVIKFLQMAEQAAGQAEAQVQWKIALEDLSARMSNTSQAIWAAVRDLHGGVLRTPYGVLVCSHAAVLDVLNDPKKQYTVDGYAERMRKSFGEIYLGLDDGPRYRWEADKPNRAIEAISGLQSFQSAYGHMAAAVQDLLAPFPAGDEATVEVKDLVDNMLARFCKEWFGVPDDQHVRSGGWRWDGDTPPACPGHFHSPSRYMFQPRPGPEASAVGEAHGQALARAVQDLIDADLAGPRNLRNTVLGRALTQIISDTKQLTGTLIGVMMGMLPTVDGNIRSTLYEWVNDRSLWDLQVEYLADQGPAYARASSVLGPPLRRTMQLRPVPELVWRTARVAHDLGTVKVEAGERIVVSIVSATQERLAEDNDELVALFGGERGKATHACPGYKMAMGMLLGMLAGLMETAVLKPTPSPVALKLSLR